jgi:hypothetical protein|nr:hypothetical protein [Kofleriaceae bacterium]
MKLAIAAVLLVGSVSVVGCAGDPAAPEDDAQLVRTPFGLFHPSCVHVAGEHADACEHEHAAAARVVDDASSDGWKTSEWFETTPLYWISAQWTVPQPPAGRSDQTLYYFPGLEPPSYDDIVQPVLAWNGYGDQAWTMTSWNCCENGNVWHSAPITVDPGDAVWGQAAGDSCNATTGVCASWQILSGDTTTGQQTTLTATSRETFTAAQGGVLETYGVAACSELAKNVKFSRVLVGAVGGKLVRPTWSPDIAAVSPACNYGASASTSTGSSTITVRDTP